MASKVSKDKLFNLQSNPNLDAADTGVDPETGRILNNKERRAIFKQRKINVSKVFGKRDELSRFAPIVKYNPGDVENAVDDSPDSISKVESAVDDSPDSISKRVRVIEKYIHDILKSIEKIQKFIVDQEKSDRKKTLEELKEKIKLDEKRKLDKKELLLEAGDEPDEEVEKEKPQTERFKKVKGFLGKLKDAFTTLFAGWLTDKGIQAFRAFQEGNMEKLRSIAKNVAVALGVIGGVLLLAKAGISKIGKLFKIVSKVFKKGLKFLFKSLKSAGKMLRKMGGQIAKLGKQILKLGKNIASNALKLAKNVVGKGKNIVKNVVGKGKNIAKNIVGKGKNVSKSLLKTGSKNVAKGAAKKGTAKLIAKKIPLVGLVLGTAFAIDRARKGDLLGAGIELISGVASTVPGVGTAISTAADVANIARDVKKSTTGEGEETSKIDSKITTNATRVNQKNEKIYDYGAPEDEVVVIDGSQDQNAGGSQTMGSPDYGEPEEEVVNFDSEDSSNMYLMGTQSEFNIF